MSEIVSQSIVNPSLPSELGEAECALLRGDAIGNTTYTNRWILNTLLKITQVSYGLQFLFFVKIIDKVNRKCKLVLVIKEHPIQTFLH